MTILKYIINLIRFICGAAEYRIDRHLRRKRDFSFKKSVCRERGLTLSGNRGLRRKW